MLCTNCLDSSDIKGIIIGIVTGIVSSTIVTLCFNYNEKKRAEYDYVNAVNNYMQKIAQMLFFLEDEHKFWTVFYNMPRYNGKIKHYNELIKYISVCYELNRCIEVEYYNYILSRNENKPSEQYIEKLNVYSSQYRKAANEIGLFFYEKNRGNKNKKRKS